MEIDNTLRLIGHTPLVHLSTFAPRPGVRIYAKLESVNPTGSIKDRIIAYIVGRAVAEGTINENTTLVEGSSGNTGAAVAMVASRLGLESIICVPEKASREKVALIRSYGAEVRVFPSGAPRNSPQEYGHAARLIAREIPGAFLVDQYENPLNPDAHYRTTGVEIRDALEGRVDAFVAAGSTGGTISGVGRCLKEANPDVCVTLADPEGSVLKAYFEGKPDYRSFKRPFLVEGAGKGSVVGAMDFGVVDDAVSFSDADAFGTALRIARDEGLVVGGSSGGNVYVAQRVAESMEGPANVVTVLPDSGLKYLSTFLDPAWMEAHGLRHPDAAEAQPGVPGQGSAASFRSAR